MKQQAARILVTGSSIFFSARLIHDLGRRGAKVTAADSLRFSAGKASRYTSQRLLLPAMNDDPGRYLELLIKELRRQPYDLLLPTFEESLLLAEYQDELRPHVRLFLPQFSAMYRLHHKPSLHEMCQSLNLPSPPTFVMNRADQLPLVTEHLNFPVVVKLTGGNNSAGRTYCDDEEQLQQAFDRLSADPRKCGGELPFVQQKIRGQLICTLCFCAKGQKLAEVIYRTLRTFPQAGGTSAHRQSIDHPEIARITERLTAATNWSGFIGFDFLVDEKTGIPYVIDANVRANPAIHLGYCAGLDWTQLILNLAEDKRPDLQFARTGVNVHTMLLDVVWLLEGLMPKAGGIKQFPQRCRQFLTPDWPVHSRGDLLATREFASGAILALQTAYSALKSLFVGSTPAQIMLDHANYDATAAAVYRAQRSVSDRERIAA
jgi:hypothetical protein